MAPSPDAGGRGGGHRQPSAAVVVVNHNGGADVEACVASLLGLDPPADDIVVVDNASADGSPERLAERFPGLRVLSTGRNAGFGGAANAGIAATTTEHVAVLNHDVVARRTWLGEALEAMQPGVGAVASLVLFEEAGRTLVNYAGGEVSFTGFAWPAQYRADPDSVPDGVRPTGYAAGGASLLRREALAAVGGFEEAFFLYHEDVDLSWRMHLAGWGVVLAPRAVLTHKWEFRRNADKFPLVERNRLLTVLSNYRAGTLLLLAPALLMVELAVLAAALGGGWTRAKLRGYREIWGLRGLVRARRRRVARLRSRSDREIVAGLRATLAYQEVQNPGVRWVLNPLLQSWYLLVRFLFESGSVARRLTRRGAARKVPPVQEHETT